MTQISYIFPHKFSEDSRTEYADCLQIGRVDKNIQGCKFLLIPSTLCLDRILRRNEVKCEGKNLQFAIAEAILVLT